MIKKTKFRILKATRKFLYKHKKINALQRVIRNINDENMIKRILNIEDKNVTTIKFYRLGMLNRDTNILLYCDPTMPGGFFAPLKHVINDLYFADLYNFTPVVEYNKNFLYAEVDEINGTHNPWEYYFEPVSDISPEKARQSFNVVLHNRAYEQFALNLSGTANPWYEITNEYIDEAGKIYEKYIRLNSYVKPIIERDIAKLIKGIKTFAVHVRGTDFKNAFKSHPLMVTFEEYIEEVNIILKKGDYEQVFIATDDIDALELFQSRFGDKLVYYKDVKRGQGKVSAVAIASERLNNNYLLGLEVLRDAYTLASCDGLIAGLSNVSLFARIIKVSMKQKYLYEKIVNKGISNSSLTVDTFYKKLKGKQYKNFHKDKENK